jgi:hypothetical protein
LHMVSIPSTGPLPPIFLCAKVGRHTYSAPFPFSCLESSFIDSIKDKFSQVPTEWLTYFEGALLPLVLYDFLDGRTITLCGHLHFTDRGILIVRRTTRTEDTLRTQPELARFMCTPRVPTYHCQATVLHRFQFGFCILMPVRLVPLRTYRLKRLSRSIT